MDQPDGVIIPKSLSYSQELGTTAPLYFVNESPHTYVFKVIETVSRSVPIKKQHFHYIPLTDSCDRTHNYKFQSKLLKNLTLSYR